MPFIETLKNEMDKKSLLKHPFYQIWNEGKLSKYALIEYAKQYYHFTEHFPRFVAAIFSQCEIPEIRRKIIYNLIEEELGDYNQVDPHAEQWLEFCKALGIEREEVINEPLFEKTKALLTTFNHFSKQDFVIGIVAILAYEWQVSNIAHTKKKGLDCFYGVSGMGLKFFETHMEADIAHSNLWISILSENTIGREENLQQIFVEALDAQWNFLSEIYEKTCAA